MVAQGRLYYSRLHSGIGICASDRGALLGRVTGSGDRKRSSTSLLRAECCSFSESVSLQARLDHSGP
jgi:hypothetical protein